MAYSSSSSPARAFYLLLLLQPICYLWFMAPHTAALSFSYNFSNQDDIKRANLTYLTNNSIAGDGFISLTKSDTYWSTGGVAYPQTVHLWDHRTSNKASFTTDFSFAISNSENNTRGDGMAFFIGAPRLAPPPDSDGGFLGLISNITNGGPPPLSTVGVEFDTNRNSWDPQNNATDHIGINVNNISSESFYKVLANGPPNPLSGTMSASIKYDGRSKVLSVCLRLANGTSYGLERWVDLKAAGVPQDATVGFSAATGDESESHQLLSWSFNSTDPSKLELWVVILLTLASALLAASLGALLWVIMHRPRRARAPPMGPIALPVARKFSYHELAAATNSFSKDRKLGQGAFGEVYRGMLTKPLMLPVAVKRLTRHEDERTRKDYVTEIMTLGELRHKNLVKLVGWCNTGGDTLLLVYELVTNGSLDEHLHGSSSSSSSSSSPPPKRLLTWPERYKIVRGIGTAIEYLHTGKQNPILHRDIKPSNVMLDDDFVAKLGDFGLVRQVIDSAEGSSSLAGTVMIGTRMYMDPVCMSMDTVSPASDMYSFGVLLLEVATGQKPAEVQGPGGLLSNTLITAVKQSYAKGEVLEMADQRLNGDFHKGQMERVLVVGLLCVQQERQHRPKIRTAVNLLSDLSLPVPQFLS